MLYFANFKFTNLDNKKNAALKAAFFYSTIFILNSLTQYFFGFPPKRGYI